MTDKKEDIKEKEPEKEKEPAVPFLTSGIGTRISDAAGLVGGKRKLANMIALSEPQLHRIVAENSQAKVEAVAEIAAATGVSLSWLITGKGDMIDQEGSVSGRYAASEEPGEYSYIPRYNIEVSAGHGAADPLHELKLEDIAFRNDWLEKQGLIKSNLAIFTARGDSMAPTIQHNDMLLIKTFSEWTRSESPDEGIYIIRLDGHLHAKRLQSDGRGGVLVKSDNPAYDTIHLEKDELPNVDIVGKVVWIGRSMT